MWGDHKIPVPYKVTEDIRSYMWGGLYVHVGDHMIPVPYKVRGTIRSYMWGDHTYMCQTIQYLFHIM